MARPALIDGGPLAAPIREALAIDPNITATELYEELRAKYAREDGGEWYVNPAPGEHDRYTPFPNLRSVQRFVAKVREAGASSAWDPWQADPDDLSHVFDFVRLAGPDHWPSEHLASWIARLRRGYPDLPAEEAHHMARWAVAAGAGTPTESGERVAVLKAWLTFRVWTNQGLDDLQAAAGGTLDRHAVSQPWRYVYRRADDAWRGRRNPNWRWIDLSSRARFVAEQEQHDDE